MLIAIGIPMYFFWRWLIRRFIKDDNKSKVATWIVTLTTTPVIYSGLFCLFIFWMSYTPGKDFDKQEWLTNREGRFVMAGDIIKSKMLIGKDTVQVKQILGEPGWRGDSARLWTYHMGWGGGFIVSLYHHLNIKLDAGKKVVSVEHSEIRD